MPRRLLLLILIATIVRLILAFVLELSNDEVYYYLYAQDLQMNYFDHPPGVGMLIRIFTFNLNLTQEVFIRLGAIICSAAGTALCYRLGTQLKNERTGWYAAILYTAGIYSSLIAGTFIIPDSPQVVFWLGACVVMHEIIELSSQHLRISTGQWLAFGLLAGLSILCKVHGVFIWFGFGAYILFFQRKLLKDYRLYLSAIITLLLISPVVWWNIQNDFITYRFHSERVAVKESLIHIDYFFQAIGGQLLYNNPINAVLILIALWKLMSSGFMGQRAVRFILLNGLPIVLVVTGMSLFNSMLPHWSGPGFIILSFLAAGWMDERKETASTALPVALKASVGLVAVAVVAAALLINFYPGTIGSKEEHTYGNNDFTLDMYGWRKFSNQFEPWLEEQKGDFLLPADIKIVANKWFPAAHLDYYVAGPLNMKVIGVGTVTDLHQYYWLNRTRQPLQKGEDAICIVPTNNPVDMQNTYLKYFSSVESLVTFPVERSGALTRYFEVYRLKGYLANDELFRGQ